MHNFEFDWISSLPDELLIRVVSFLTTKEAVQTCILSKRWKRIWTNLPVLKFNVYEFGVHYLVGINDEARTKFTRFNQFVNGVVENLESTHIDRFYYAHDYTSSQYSYKVPMQWLDRIALLMPQLIDISIAGVRSLELPDSLSCATLQHLKIKLIEACDTTIKLASINLPSLKVFDAMGIQLHEKFAQTLLMGCPSLETLKLGHCALHCSNIFSNTLNVLDISWCRLYEPMQISCPSLLSLRIDTNLTMGAGISLKNMNSLKIASIVLKRVPQHVGDDDVPALNIFDGLSCATNLKLHIYSPDIKVQLEKDFLNCRNLNNLKKLVICMWTMSFDFNLVASLLKLSPNVEKLSLVLDPGHSVIQKENRQEVLGDVLFQHKFIETVKIRHLYRRKLPQVLIKTLMNNLDTCIKEIGNVIIQ